MITKGQDMKKLIWMSLTIGLLAVGVACDRDDDGDGEEESAVESAAEPVPVEKADVEPHPMWGQWWADGNVEAIQGEWEVTQGGSRPGGKRQTHWSFDATWAVYERLDRDEQEHGRISFPKPGRMEHKSNTESGSLTKTFHFAREGNDIYLGTGVAGVVLEDRIIVGTRDEYLIYHRDDGSCMYHEIGMFRLDKGGVETECSIEEHEGQDHFVYSTPDGERQVGTGQSIIIGEQAVTDKNLRENKLSPR